MTENPIYHYQPLDQPAVLAHIFHPRPEAGGRRGTGRDMMMPMADGTRLHACLFSVDKAAPLILFFHGNGEIVSDYDPLGPIYNKMGLNFLVVDYRGYGRSSGVPTVSHMMADAGTVLKQTREMLDQEGYTGRLSVMGRSLGSACALELAAAFPDALDCLILESGFAHADKLLKTLGLDPAMLGMDSVPGFGNLEKMSTWYGPTLILHGELDQLIPFSDARDLYRACPSSDKTLVPIPGAGHNDIFMRGLELYMQSVKRLVLGKSD